MKRLYKNKRDFYKAESERKGGEVEFWKKEAEAKQKKIEELMKPPVEKKVDCSWFCPNCRVVESGTKGINYDIEGGRCLSCGHLGIKAVTKKPFSF